MITNELVSAFLEKRAISQKDLSYLMHPDEKHRHDPLLMSDMPRFIEMLHSVKGKKITVMADYDADGVLSGTLARVGLYLLGFGEVPVYAPHAGDGYGLTPISVDRMLSLFPDTEVVITTDNGSNAFEGVAYAVSKGLRVLVTDHHLSNRDPVAEVVVNPNRRHKMAEDRYPFSHLSGTAVIHKVLDAYISVYGHTPLSHIHYSSLVFLTGVSVLSDVMPMVDENRYFVFQAVRMFEKFIAGSSYDRILTYGDSPIEQYYRGLDLLVHALDEAGKIKYGIDEDTFGFLLGPILNSPRRMTGSSLPAFQLFQTHKDTFEVEEVAQKLLRMNEERKAYVRTLLSDLVVTVEGARNQGVDPIHFAAFTVATDAGVAGLLAGEYVSRYGLPCVAFSAPVVQDAPVINGALSTVLTGSARAPEGINLYGILSEIDQECPGLLLKWGGHAQAAGLSIDGLQFDRFRAVFVGKIHSVLLAMDDPEDSAMMCLPTDADFLLLAGDVSPLAKMYTVPQNITVLPLGTKLSSKDKGMMVDSLSFFEKLKPYGQGFKKPTFSLIFKLNGITPFFMGSDKQHVKLQPLEGLSVIQWNAAADFQGVLSGYVLVEGSLSINTFREQVTLQIIADSVRKL